MGGSDVTGLVSPLSAKTSLESAPADGNQQNRMLSAGRGSMSGLNGRIRVRAARVAAGQAARPTAQSDGAAQTGKKKSVRQAPVLARGPRTEWLKQA